MAAFGRSWPVTKILPANPRFRRRQGRSLRFSWPLLAGLPRKAAILYHSRPRLKPLSAKIVQKRETFNPLRHHLIPGQSFHVSVNSHNVRTLLILTCLRKNKIFSGIASCPAQVVRDPRFNRRAVQQNSPKSHSALRKQLNCFAQLGEIPTQKRESAADERGCARIREINLTSAYTGVEALHEARPRLKIVVDYHFKCRHRLSNQMPPFRGTV